MGVGGLFRASPGGLYIDMYTLVSNPVSSSVAKAGSEFVGGLARRLPNRIVEVKGEYFLYRRHMAFKAEPPPPTSSGLQAGADIKNAPTDKSAVEKGFHGASSTVCVLACPDDLTLDSLFRLGGATPSSVRSVHIFFDPKNRRRLVVLRLDSPDAATEYLQRSNGTAFRKSKLEVCHVVFVEGLLTLGGHSLPLCEGLPMLSVSSPDTSEASPQGPASTSEPRPSTRITPSTPPLQLLPPSKYMEIPACPLCLERLDSAISGLIWPAHASAPPQTTAKRWSGVRCRVCDFVREFTSRTHPSSATRSGEDVKVSETETKPFFESKALECSECQRQSGLQDRDTVGSELGGEPVPSPSSTPVSTPPTPRTGDLRPIWICLLCGNIGCGRFQRSHAVRHYERTGHRFSLIPVSESIWDYHEDRYVHRILAQRTRGFAGTYTLSAAPDSADAGSLTTVKLKSISGHYNRLLRELLSRQHQHHLKELNDMNVKTQHMERDLARERREKTQLKQETDSLGRAARAAAKKASTLQSKVQKQSQDIIFLRDLNEALLKDQAGKGGSSKRKNANSTVSSKAQHRVGGSKRTRREAAEIAALDRTIEGLQKRVSSLMAEIEKS